MGTVQTLAEEAQRGLTAALPKLRKTVVKKLSLALGAMLEARTPNTSELANLLPLATERQDRREQWFRRRLKNPLLVSADIREPLARQVLGERAGNGQTIVLSLDQTAVGDRFAVLMLTVRVGDRSLPLAWGVEAGAANRGFAGQHLLLERVRAWLPAGAAVLLLADRFYPSAELLTWLHQHGWQYRLRLKGKLTVDIGVGDIHTTGDLAVEGRERYAPNARLFAAAVPPNIGVLHEAGHPEPGIIAMDCRPQRATVLDYGARWAIESTFSAFKSRGFDLEQTHLQAPARLERLILIMALAMYWCVRVGRHDALCNPTPVEKKPRHRPTPTIGASKRSGVASCRGSDVAYVYC